jgi:hypothetical protein
MNTIHHPLKFALGLALVLVSFAASSVAQERLSYFRTIVIEPGVYKGSVTCVACGVIVKGTVEGEVVAVGGDVIVYGKVDNDIVASGGAIHLKNGAAVTRDVVAIGGPITYEGQVTTPGREGYSALPWIHIPGQRSIGWRGALALFGFLIACVLLPIALLRPRRIQNVANASRRWIATGLLGLAAITVFTYLFDWIDQSWAKGSDTFEIAGGVVFLLLLAVGIAGIALAVGQRFFRGQFFPALAAGTALFAVLELVPVAGFVVMMAGGCWAMGSAVWSGLGFRTTQGPDKSSASAELRLAG